jgi:hypothetical protein
MNFKYDKQADALDAFGALVTRASTRCTMYLRPCRVHHDENLGAENL